MKIFAYDDDPRLKSEGLELYSQNCGSFAVITNNLNKELDKLQMLGDEQTADCIGFSSGLKWDFGFSDRKRFLINVWETNILPQHLINMRKALEGPYYRIFGLSEQISQVWRNYGFPTETVDIGADPDFWAPQPIKKFDKFTIISTVCCNFRSGIFDLIDSFLMAAQTDKDIRLIIKNTDERAKKLPILIKSLQDAGYDIVYNCERSTMSEVRTLMAKSHMMSYPVINTSAGLPILEAASMELPCVVNDFTPVHLYPVAEKVKCEEMPISVIKDHLVNACELPYTFPAGWIDESKATIHYPHIEDLAQNILKIKNNYDIYINKAKQNRQEIIKNWTWKHSLEQLLNGLK